MRIGVMLGDETHLLSQLPEVSRRPPDLEVLLREAQRLEARGFASAWLVNIFEFDAIGTIAIIGRGTERMELGTAVVPTFPRHPFTMAQQALTAQAATRRRFTLGIGLSHRIMMEDMLGFSWNTPARHMREYLMVLAPRLEGRPVAFQGEHYRVNAALLCARDRAASWLRLRNHLKSDQHLALHRDKQQSRYSDVVITHVQANLTPRHDLLGREAHAGRHLHVARDAVHGEIPLQNEVPTDAGRQRSGHQEIGDGERNDGKSRHL